MNRSTRLGLALIVLTLGLGATPLRAQVEDDVIDSWLERAGRFEAKGLWRRAGNYFAKVTAADPDDEDTARRLGIALMGSGGYEDLDALTRTWLEKKPQDRSWVLLRHDLLRETGRDDEAASLLRGFLGEGKDFEIESLIARLDEDHGRDAEAENRYADLIDRAKAEVLRSAPDLVGLARAQLFWPHGGDEGEKSLRAAAKADPEYLPVQLELARVFSDRKELPVAMLSELKRALEIRPRWPATIALEIQARDLMLGIAEGEKRAAIDLLLNVNPRHPDGLYYRGMRGLSDALWDRSRTSFKEGLEVNPNHLKLNSGLAALDYVTHDIAAHDAGMKRVLELDPTYGRGIAIVAEGLSERRRWDESLAMMEKAVLVDPKDYVLWDWLARYALYIGEEKRGREAMSEAEGLVSYGRTWRSNMIEVMGLLEKSFVTRSSEHFIMKMHKDDVKILEKFVPDFMERSYAEFVERYGIEPRQPIILDIFQRQSDFSVRTMGTTGLGALGVCFGPTVYMFIPRRTRQPVNWASTAHHELAHVFTLQRSKGRVPRWLTEGLSSWEEVRRDPSWGRNMEPVLQDAMASGKILGVMDFDSAFYGPRIIFAYFQGGLAAQFIEENWGMEAIRKMLILYGEDRLTDEVLREALKVSPKEFDARFLAWVRTMLAPLKRIPTYDEEAIERFQTAIAAGDDVENNRIKAAWGHFRADRLVDANAQLKELLAANCKAPEFRLLLAERARALKNIDEARKIYGELMAEGFENFDMTVTMAQMLDKEGKGDDALALWKLAATQNPWIIEPSRSPHIVLADRYRTAGDEEGWARETAAFCKLVDIAVDFRAELVEYHRGRGEFEAALAYQDEILLVSTFDAEQYRRRGEILVEMNRAAEAVAPFETALEVEPDGAKEFEARVALGRLLIDLDRKDDAVYHLVRALELRPGDATAKKLLESAEGE